MISDGNTTSGIFSTRAFVFFRGSGSSTAVPDGRILGIEALAPFTLIRYPPLLRTVAVGNLAFLGGLWSNLDMARLGAFLEAFTTAFTDGSHAGHCSALYEWGCMATYPTFGQGVLAMAF